MNRETSVRSIEDPAFAFFDTVCVSQNGQLLAIQFFNKDKRNKFTKYENTKDQRQVIITELPSPPKYRSKFALCLIDERYLLLTGGKDENGQRSVETFVFDLVVGQWLVDPLQPSLKEPRTKHASCATQSSVFVFGGFNNEYKTNSFERRQIDIQGDLWSNIAQAEWKSFTIEDFSARSIPVMAAISPQLIMVFGGYFNDYLSDGIVIDAETLSVERRLSAGEIKFECDFNRCCASDSGSVVAIVRIPNRGTKFIEISTVDFEVTVMQENI